MSDIKPDWENFAKAVLTEWPTGDLHGSVLFDLSLQYGMIQEVPGGYNSDHHIDADCICPEEGDPWYEYTFRGEAGPGLYSINDMNRRIEELEAKLAKAVEGLESIIDDCDPRWQVPHRYIRDAAQRTLAELKGDKL
jgi:hypothetical protein